MQKKRMGHATRNSRLHLNIINTLCSPPPPYFVAAEYLYATRVAPQGRYSPSKLRLALPPLLRRPSPPAPRGAPPPNPPLGGFKSASRHCPKTYHIHSGLPWGGAYLLARLACACSGPPPVKRPATYVIYFPHCTHHAR